MAKKYWTYKGKKVPVKKYRPRVEKTNEQLYRELVRKTGQANKRIRQIRQEFGLLGWSGNKLKEKTEFQLINAWKGSKGIRVSRNMSEIQMKATLHELNKFLKSKSSTVKGIKSIMKKQQDSMRKTFKQYDIDLTPEESETLYQMFDDPDFSWIYQYLDPSELEVCVVDAKEHGDSLEQFINRLITHGVPASEFNDLDKYESIIRLYSRWVM